MSFSQEEKRFYVCYMTESSDTFMVETYSSLQNVTDFLKKKYSDEENPIRNVAVFYGERLPIQKGKVWYLTVGDTCICVPDNAGSQDMTTTVVSSVDPVYQRVCEQLFGNDAANKQEKQ